MPNLDKDTVEGFGKEWARFHYRGQADDDVCAMFSSYFGWVAGDLLKDNGCGADFGCGSGRWAALVAARVCELWCIDASEEALAVAQKNLAGEHNCYFVRTVIGDMGISDGTFDFGYSLGVLHHVPDTDKALWDCVRTLKRGAPFLLYLYYALDGRPFWYRTLWKFANALRLGISKLPSMQRALVCEGLASVIYWPLARLAKLGEKAGCDVSNWPLSFYRRKSFYVLRNDALDRFGTRLEKRFTKVQIFDLMRKSGLRDIRFSKAPPYWVAIGWKG